MATETSWERGWGGTGKEGSGGGTKNGEDERFC